MARFKGSSEAMEYDVRRQRLYSSFIISINNTAEMIYFSRKKDLFTKFYLHVDLRRILKKSQKELKDEIRHNQNQGKTTTLKVNVYTHPKNHMYPVCINHTEIEIAMFPEMGASPTLHFGASFWTNDSHWLSNDN